MATLFTVGGLVAAAGLGYIAARIEDVARELRRVQPGPYADDHTGGAE